jgi:NAD+ kinase
MENRPAIVANCGKPKALETARRLVEIFKGRDVEPMLEPDLAESIGLPGLAAGAERIKESAGIVISLGGDGTILRSAAIVFPRVIPVLGLNFGKLGFLAHTAAETLDEVADRVLASRLNTQDRLVLECDGGEPDGESLYALNEFAVHHGPLSRTIRIDCALDGRRLRRYHADGVIVATPTGSTAYSLSAGGPLVEPNMEVLLVAPICPHGLAERPVVVAASHRVELTLLDHSEEVSLVVDGQSSLKMNVGQTVSIKTAPFPFRLASLDELDFFQALNEKMGWGGGTVRL